MSPVVYLNPTFERFPPFAVNNAAMNIGVEIFIQFVPFDSFGSVL